MSRIALRRTKDLSNRGLPRCRSQYEASFKMLRICAIASSLFFAASTACNVSAAPIEVVLEEQSAGIAASGRGHAHFRVIKDGASIASLGGSDDFDIGRSKAYCDELIALGRAERGYCEPNYRYRASAVPNDPSQGQLYSPASANLTTAWDTTTGSSSVIIAIIDTGVDYDHPDLSANIWSNSADPADGVDNDGNGFTDDSRGWDFVESDNTPSDENHHGTHVAGTAGAVGNNGVGVAGASWSSRLMPVRVLDAEGSGFLSDIAAGIRYAADNGAHVINLSLGGGGSSETLERAVEYACGRGVSIIVAAGNEATDNDFIPSYPANISSPCLISVAAIDSNDNLASFTNYGATTVHLAAAGVSIYSTLPGNDYGFLSGTSMATPLVAGIAALVKHSNSALQGSDIKTVLTSTITPIAAASGALITGGKVNAAAAVSLGLRTQPGAIPDPGDTDPSPAADIAFGINQHVVTSDKVSVNGLAVYADTFLPAEGQRVALTCIKGNRTLVAGKLSGATKSDGVFRITIKGAKKVSKFPKATCLVSSGSSFSGEFNLVKRPR